MRNVIFFFALGALFGVGAVTATNVMMTPAMAGTVSGGG